MVSDTDEKREDNNDNDNDDDNDEYIDYDVANDDSGSKKRETALVLELDILV